MKIVNAVSAITGKDNLSSYDIAKQVGVTSSTIRHWCYSANQKGMIVKLETFKKINNLLETVKNLKSLTYQKEKVEELVQEIMEPVQEVVEPVVSKMIHPEYWEDVPVEVLNSIQGSIARAKQIADLNKQVEKMTSEIDRLRKAKVNAV